MWRPYPVKFRMSREGYAVSCADLPGCWLQGANREEALRNIREATRDIQVPQRSWVGVLTQ